MINGGAVQVPLRFQPGEFSGYAGARSAQIVGMLVHVR